MRKQGKFIRLLCVIARKGTYDVVVLAADGGCVALALANTDNGDRGAVKADKDVQGDNDVEEVEEVSDRSSSASLLRVYQKIENLQEILDLTVWV